MAELNCGIGCLAGIAGIGILIVLLALDEVLFGGRGEDE